MCYSEQPSSTINELLVSAGSGNTNFTCQIPDLNPNTTYNVRSFITLDSAIIYGNEASFTTSGSANWQLETLPLTGVTNTSANGGANFISYGSGNISNKRLCYSEQPSSTINELLVSAGSGNANFTCQIPDLNPNTTFNVRLFVTLDNTTIYGNEQSFNTLTNPVSLVTTYDCSSLSGFTTYYEGMNNSYGAWGLSGSGYDGSCLIAPNPNNSGNLGSTVGLHYIELATNFNNNGFIELWLNTFKRGNNNLIP